MIKVLIADDSLLARAVLKDIFLLAPDIAVIGEAGNGKEAIDKTRLLKPDLVVLDLLMPVMDGITAIEEIMATTPVPILVLSATLDDKEVTSAFVAIKKGALDVMGKPEGTGFRRTGDFDSRLIEKVRLLSRIKVIHHPLPRLAVARAETKQSPPAGTPPFILAIGASTGGPRAVVSIMRSLPSSFPGAVLVVQHIAAGFAPGFAKWVAGESKIPVKLGEAGDVVAAGEVIIAPNDSHMVIENGKVQLLQTAPVNNCRPSIDVFFRSLAADQGARVMGVLLTGMGKDGAMGLLRLREEGGVTIAQDEESSAVFGMPKAAIDLNAAQHVLSLSTIPDFIVQSFTAGAGARRLTN